MIVPFPVRWPVGAAMGQKAAKAMNVILHVGAHRCATTTFQYYLRENRTRLAEQGIGFWGPGRTRYGLFSGILPGPRIARGRDLRRRAPGRIRMNLARCDGNGLRTMVISDENMLGSVRANLRLGGLYDGVGERMARFSDAFDGVVTDVVLNIRSLEHYWASALGYGLTRGYKVPGRATLNRLVDGPRSWRDVITDVACTVGDARLWVLPFETFAGRPDTQLMTMTGAPAPSGHARAWLNATPRLNDLHAQLGRRVETLPRGDGRWQPFDAVQCAVLREKYVDDLFWLTSGADGLAWLMDDPDTIKARMNGPAHDLTRGTHNDNQERGVA